MKKQVKVGLAIAALAVVSLIAGCEIFSPYAKLYGKWSAGSAQSFEFKTDDTFSLSSGSGSSEVVLSGTYTATATTFKLTGTKYALGGVDMTSTYGAYITAYNLYDFTWSVSGTELSITTNGNTSTWTKQ